jgi:hypothetical protein
MAIEAPASRHALFRDEELLDARHPYLAEEGHLGDAVAQ